MESVSLSTKSDKPKSSDSRNTVECESIKARLNTKLGNFQADLNKVQVPFSWKDGGQDINEGSVDNVDESPS